MHRSQQAGLADAWLPRWRVRRHRACTETSTSACQFVTVILPMLPTTTSLIITGEFDSSVADIRDFDVVGLGVGSASDGAGQR